ncbi:Putative sodium bile acid cotransporter, sodium/solute symporter superfamily [Septoria linicola]|uniref:Sodium bile acid cotransporter, sodium/solute symporter superfamily n=1 Tax=Septoria linicola TaxID=215465 RepID=A0A9Q9ALQ7_9PEZI|nr:Putative sodium bile acid cotransporter, sodium/solute symporter superfamily [Septoria linicola]
MIQPAEQNVRSGAETEQYRQIRDHGRQYKDVSTGDIDSDVESKAYSERPKSVDQAHETQHGQEQVIDGSEIQRQGQEQHDPAYSARNTPAEKDVDVVALESEDQSKEAPQHTWRSRALTFLDDQWFLISMGLLIILASQVQVPQSRQTVKSRIISYLCVCIIFFATGCTLDSGILIRNYARWKAHLWVQGQCFLLCSAIMFGVVSATATNKDFMDPGLLVGLIFMSCIPTTLASNVVMTAQAKGNQELTVVQVTLGNFIGVFITPALVVMYTFVSTWYNDVLSASNTGQFGEVYRRVFKQLGLSIFVPLAFGQAARYFYPDLGNKIFKKNLVMKRIPSLAMLVIIWSTYDQAFSSGAFDTVPASNKIFLVFILLAIWLVYLGISVAASLFLFPKRDIVAIAYCVTGKGPATGIPLSISIFSGLGLELESKIQIPVVIYQSLSIGFGSMLIVLFRKWIEREAKQRKNDR